LEHNLALEARQDNMVISDQKTMESK